jgi:PST family polysaccharide transporter
VGASRFGGKLLFFVSTLLLARLLDKEDFGVAAYAITLITLIASVPGLGLAPALIHHRDDPEMLDTGFWLGMAAGVLTCAAVWVVAPQSAWFFGDERAVGVTRALGFVFPLESLRNVHATLLRKRLEFRRRFVPEMAQALVKGAIAIAMALAGFGYWSLIWGTLVATAFAIPIYWSIAGWRPGLRVDAAAARELLPFGSHVVAVDLLGALVRNVDYLFVGRLLGAATLGVYTLAFRLPDLLVRNLCVVVGQVLLPVYAGVRDRPDVVRSTFLAAIGYVPALAAPVAIGLALLAEPLVLTAFGERWLEVAPVLPPVCIYALLISVIFNLGDLYKALGRPEVLTRLSLLRAVIGVPAIWFAASVGGSAAAVGWAQAGVAASAVVANLVVAGTLFGLPVGTALFRALPIALASAGLAAAVLAVEPLVAESHPAVQLLVCGLAGGVAYAVALRLLAREFWDVGVRALLDASSGRRGRSVVGEAIP